MAQRDIWTEQQRLSLILGAWGLGSVAVGELLRRAGRRRGSAFLVGFGRQQSGWGAIDAAIAGFGAIRSRQKQAGLPDPDAAAVQESERSSLHRILLVNTGLDLLYLAGGVLLIVASDAVSRRSGREAALVRGDGAGVLLQGGFLLVLDSAFAARTVAAPR